MVLMITMPISLTLHLAVLAWALVFTALLAQKPKWPLALAAGVFWGVLALGRPAIVAFLPLVLLWLWWNRRTRQDWLKSCSLILVAATLVLLPWTVRNYRIHGRLILVSTNSGATFWNGNSPFSTGTGLLGRYRKGGRIPGTPARPKPAARRPDAPVSSATRSPGAGRNNLRDRVGSPAVSSRPGVHPPAAKSVAGPHGPEGGRLSVVPPRHRRVVRCLVDHLLQTALRDLADPDDRRSCHLNPVLAAIQPALSAVCLLYGDPRCLQRADPIPVGDRAVLSDLCSALRSRGIRQTVSCA